MFKKAFHFITYRIYRLFLCFSQLGQSDIPGWPEKLSDPLLADAICDRIVHDAYTVVIGGKESMRRDHPIFCVNLQGGV